MKKLILLILCGLLLFSLVACDKNQEESTTSEESSLEVETTEKTISDISDQTNINMTDENFQKVDSVEIIDMRTGDEILITNETQVQNIIKFVKNINGKNRESSKGICDGLYSIDFISGKKTINGVGLCEFGIDYGEGEDGYPYRYEYCDDINQDVVFQFFDKYFNQN